MMTIRGGSRVRAILTFVGVLGATGFLTWYLSRRSAPPAETAGHNHAATPASDSARVVMLSTEAAQRIGVTYAPVQLGPLGRVVRTVGIVSYDETRLKSVTSRVDGWVEQLFVNFSGQAVRVGDPLFALYSPMLVAAQQELLLAKRLRGDVAAGTPDAVRSSDDLLQSARRRLLYWEVPPDEVKQIEESGEIRKAITLRSPVNGVVIEKSVLAGQRIMAGETIYQIADLSTVWLDGEVYERDLPSVRLGREVVAEFPALPGGPRTGQISYIYPTINPETRTARVRVTLPNPGLALKPGMYSTFQFAAATEPVLSIPRSAILSTGKRNLVFVRRSDGMLEPRDVGIGISTDERIEIVSGLALGDTVVSSATFLVDAESNLGPLLGGMGNMPGMDFTAPTAPNAGARRAPGPAAPRPPKDTLKMKMPDPAGAHSGHTSPQRD
jgi:Cu(I)/Ag(I) efflux system membrane fusion protein